MAESGYGKRPLWQWIVIYGVIGLVVYGAIYYFVLAKKGGYNSSGYSLKTPDANQQINSTSSAPVSKNSVEISNYTFSPATLTIKVGDTVIWTNQDSADHSATADDNSFNTGVLGKGKSETITFTKAGTIAYHCSVHPSMRGTIIIQ